jgi:membrane protein DedA with SNARE-associated domain
MAAFDALGVAALLHGSLFGLSVPPRGLPLVGLALLALPILASTHFTTGRFRRFVEDYGLLVLALAAAVMGIVGITLFFVGDRELLRDLVRQYGLYALFFVFILEGGMLLYFAPSEALVPVAIAVLLPADPGVAGYAMVIGVATVGATIGQYGLFALANRGGREYLLTKPWFRISPDQLSRFDRWFKRWGILAVPVSNALLLTRGMLTVPAGLADMSDRQFVALSAAGTVVFETWLAVGWLFLEPYVAGLF